MTKRYLFFLRHYNDIDNITPAVYYFLNESDSHIADVILYDSSYDYRNNENLEFLKDSFGERFSYKWLGEYIGINPVVHDRSKALAADSEPTNSLYLFFKGLLNFLIKSILRMKNFSTSVIRAKFMKPKTEGRTKNQTSTDIGSLCRGINKNNELTDDTVKAILFDKIFPSLVIFDINRTSEVKGLLVSLRKHGVKKIICLPVSPLINFNTLRQEKLVDLRSEMFYMLHDYSGFDAIGYVDNYFIDSYNRTFKLLGIESTLKGKTRTLGSIRFCPAWLKIRERYIKPFQYDTDKIKTVLFFSNPVTNINWAEVERVLDFFLNYPEYCLLVKHHTRTQIKKDQINFPHVAFVDDTNSSALIDWADVVLFWSTSIAIEGYIKNKTMVCLSYLSGNRNLYELYDAGFIVRCRDDLHEFLELYKYYAKLATFNRIGIQKLIDRVIVPGGDKVINNYLEFMREYETDL